MIIDTVYVEAFGVLADSPDSLAEGAKEAMQVARITSGKLVILVPNERSEKWATLVRTHFGVDTIVCVFPHRIADLAGPRKHLTSANPKHIKRWCGLAGKGLLWPRPFNDNKEGLEAEQVAIASYS